MIYSYIVYITTVIVATFLAGLAQKYSYFKKGRLIPHPLFWSLSMLVLIFTMGLRAQSIGVDDFNYLVGYNYANSRTVFEYYQIYATEPLFYLLYRITDFIFNDFQWLIIITSAITVFLFYKAFSYETQSISLPLGIFIFATTQYFYFFGIIRLGIAVAIIVFAYRYILQNKKFKFTALVMLATGFHYSALFALILLFVRRSQNRLSRNTILKIIVLIPVSFLTVRFIVFPFLPMEHFQTYIESTGFIGLSFVTSLPFLLLFILHYNSFLKNGGNYQFYFILFIIKFITEIFAPIIGIGRMVWYVNFSLCFLIPATIRVNKDKSFKITILILMFLYCIVYSFYAYFGDSHRGSFMLPYKNVLFGD